MDRGAAKYQLSKICKRLHIKNATKLNRTDIVMLYNFLLKAMAQHSGDALVIAIETVFVHMKYSLLNFAYTTEDWSSMAQCFATFFHCIMNIISLDPLFLDPKHSTLAYNAIELFLSTINKTANLQNLVLASDGANLLKIMSKEEMAFNIREVVIRNFELLIKGCPRDSRKQFFFQNQSFIRNVFVTILPKLGDYVLQELLLGTLLRISISSGDWKETFKNWFPNCQLGVDALNPRRFDITSRAFLNQINYNAVSSNRVYTLACLQIIAVDCEILLKPEGYDEFWVDFNTRTGDFHMLCYGGPESLARVTLKHDFVKEINCKQGIFTSTQGKLQTVEFELKLLSAIVIPLQHKDIRCSSFLMVFQMNPYFFEVEQYFIKIHYSSLYKGFHPTHFKVAESREDTSFERTVFPSRTPSVSSISKASSFRQFSTSSASIIVDDDTRRRHASSTPKVNPDPKVVLKKTPFENVDTTLVKVEPTPSKMAEATTANEKTPYTPGNDEYVDLHSAPLQNSSKKIVNKSFPSNSRLKACKRISTRNVKPRKKGKFEQLCDSETVDNRLDCLRSGKEEVDLNMECENLVSPIVDVANLSVEYPLMTDNIEPIHPPPSPPPSVPILIEIDINTNGICSRRKPRTEMVQQKPKGKPESVQVIPASTCEPNLEKKMTTRGIKRSHDQMIKTDILAALTSLKEQFTSCVNHYKLKMDEMKKEFENIEKSVSNIQDLFLETAENIDAACNSVNVFTGNIEAIQSTTTQKL